MERLREKQHRGAKRLVHALEPIHAPAALLIGRIEQRDQWVGIDEEPLATLGQESLLVRPLVKPGARDRPRPVTRVSFCQVCARLPLRRHASRPRQRPGTSRRRRDPSTGRPRRGAERLRAERTPHTPPNLVWRCSEMERPVASRSLERALSAPWPSLTVQVPIGLACRCVPSLIHTGCNTEDPRAQRAVPLV